MIDRRVQAYQWRVEGKTYREIGEFLGVSSTRARQLVCSGSPEWQSIRCDVLTFRAEHRPYKEFMDAINERKMRANETCLQMNGNACRRMQRW